MTKKEIIDGNKLIDEFNEFYLKNLGFSDTELNYNTSWDCLMPVCIKLGMKFLSTDIVLTYKNVINEIRNLEKN